MPFDIATAKPIKISKFDIATARPIAEEVAPEMVGGVGGAIPREEFEKGRRNWIGNITERPEAVSREAIRANRGLSLAGPLAGTLALTGIGGKKAKEAAAKQAINPTSETFQEENLRKFYGEAKEGALGNVSTIGKVIPGMEASAIGLVEDMATSPLQALLALAPKVPTGKGISLAKRVSETQAGKAVGRFATMPIEETLPGRVVSNVAGEIKPSSVGRKIERTGATITGIEPEDLVEVRQRGFRNVLDKKYYSKKIPEVIQEKIEANLESLEKGAGSKFDQVTASLAKEPFDAKNFRREAIKEAGDVLKNPFDTDISKLDKKILKAVLFKTSKVKTLGDALDLRRSLDKVLWTEGNRGLKSDFGKKIRDILTKELHKNEILKSADDEWYTLKKTLRENKKILGETGENYLKRFSKLTDKQKQALSNLEKEIGGEPFIDDLTNWSLAQKFKTPTMSTVYPSSILQTLTRPAYRGYLRTLGTSDIPKKGPISLKSGERVKQSNPSKLLPYLSNQSEGSVSKNLLSSQINKSVSLKRESPPSNPVKSLIEKPGIKSKLSTPTEGKATNALDEFNQLNKDAQEIAGKLRTTFEKHGIKTVGKKIPTIKEEVVKPVKVIPPKKSIQILPRKEQLLTQIKEAIGKAPDEATTPETLKVTFQIDGGAKIPNTKQSLTNFYDKIKKTSATDSMSTEKASSTTRSTSKKETIDKLFKLPIPGYFSDGKLIIKGVPPKTVKYDESRPLLPKKIITDILDTSTKPAEKLYYAVEGEDYGVSNNPLPQMNKDVSPKVIFKSEDSYYVYDQFRFNAINNRFPNANYGISEKGYLTVYVKNEPAAVLLPIDKKGIKFKEPPLMREAKEAGLLKGAK